MTQKQEGVSETPERIEIDTHEAKYLCAVTFHDPHDTTPSTLYTRADLSDAKDKRIAELERAGQEYIDVLKARIAELEATIENLTAHIRVDD